jgi:hypothetical protein
MTRSDIPEHVHAVIARHIDSVQQVELLALMRDDPGRVWTPAEFCSALHLTPGACAAWIGRFAAAGIVSNGGGAVRYTANGADSQALDDLVDLYTRRRISVVDAIYSKPPAA